MHWPETVNTDRLVLRRPVDTDASAIFDGYAQDPDVVRYLTLCPHEPHRETIVTTRATGTFTVKLTPQPSDTPAEGSPLGRMTIDKQFHGDLEGTSKGEMLTAGTAIKNSAAYVAVERVTGTLHGRKGTFALHHTGVMNRGQPSLTITVVPDSGTSELEGLAGTMSIDVANGNHSYVFEYTLTAS